MIKCPFCKGEIKIGYTDHEGNIRDEDYFNGSHYSGLCYIPIHDIEENTECPIATHYDEILGTVLYDSEDELKKAFKINL